MSIAEVSRQEALARRDEPRLEIQTQELAGDPDHVLLWIWLWERQGGGPSGERLLMDAQRTERRAVEAEIDELATRHSVGLVTRRDPAA